ncbi:MAG: chloride channel protein [Desulfurococcales archaeon]|nr:chloride channel protein [Desulfurococcales archaeon]
MRPGGAGVRLKTGLRDIELWIILGALIGLLSGLAGASLTILIEDLYPRLAGRLGGEVLVNKDLSTSLLPVIPLMALGGLASGLITWLFAPEAEGHGTDQVIEAIHKRKAEVRARVAVWKIIASSILIGTGGSAGKEGPIAQSGAGIGSLIAGLMRLTRVERRLLVLAGVAGGISSVFKAPLGAVIFSLEVPYKRDVESETITPIAVSSITAYLVSLAILGGETIFPVPAVEPGEVLRPGTITLLLGIGVLTGLMARVFVRTFYWVAGTFDKAGIPKPLKPALGGLLAGVVAFIFPGVMGQSYWIVSDILEGVSYGAAVLVAVSLAKIAATSFSVGSGGSGGVFGPSIVIGSLGGAGIALAFGSNLYPAAAIIGMVSFLAAAGKVPLAAVVMTAEMTRGYALVAPAIGAVGLSMLVAGGDSIYRSQVDTRIDSPFYLGMELREILRKVRVRQVMTTKVVTVRPDNTLLDVLRLIGKTGHRGFPVVDEAGRVVGMITERDIARYPRTRLEEVRVGDAMTRNLVVATPDETLDDAMTKIIRYTIGRLPVVESTESMKLVGIVTPRDILRAYKALEAVIE